MWPRYRNVTDAQTDRRNRRADDLWQYRDLAVKSVKTRLWILNNKPLLWNTDRQQNDAVWPFEGNDTSFVVDDAVVQTDHSKPSTGSVSRGRPAFLQPLTRPRVPHRDRPVIAARHKPVAGRVNPGRGDRDPRPVSVWTTHGQKMVAGLCVPDSQ